MDISVVVPLYNEEESLPELVSWIHSVMKENGFSYEILLVDDGSTDYSWSVIEELHESYPSIRGIRFQKNYGKSAALHVGFQNSRGKVVITMDADLQDSPEEIPGLYQMIIEEKYDLVSGWKKNRKDPLSKTIPSKFYNFITRKVSGINNLHDFNCGLKAYRSDVIKNIEVYGEMHRYIPLIAKWAGFKKIGEKVVQHQERKFGKSKFGMNRLINGFLDLVTITLTERYFKKPMHFFGPWGVFFAILGSLDLLYLMYLKLILGVGLAHRIPALFFGAVTLIVGILLFSTGLLAELIGRNSTSRNTYKILTHLDAQVNQHS